MPSWVLVGPGDDAAVIEPERGALDVLTTDAQVEGIHFDRRFVPPDAIGHRALAVNFSDLAAMGAEPRAALLSLVLPDELEVAVVDGIAGRIARARRSGIAWRVIGGNITRIAGAADDRRHRDRIGEAAADADARRRAAGRRGLRHRRDRGRRGRIAVVAGVPGDGPEARAADLTGSPDCRREADLQAAGRGEYLRPEPRVRAGLLLGRNRAASACIDLSDGLADGLRQIAAASGVGITVDEAAIPLADGVARVSPQPRQRPVVRRARRRRRLRAAVHGAARAGAAGCGPCRSQAGDLPITRIGVVTRDTAIDRRERQPATRLPAGFEHFR